MVANITFAQALDGRIMVEGALLDEPGDGVYTVNIHGKDKEVLGEYEFNVGSSPETDTEKVDDASGDSEAELLTQLILHYLDRCEDDDDDEEEEDDDDDAVYDAVYDEDDDEEEDE